MYYEKKLEECKSNMKSTWRLLNEVLNNKKSKSYLQTTFNNDNREIIDLSLSSGVVPDQMKIARVIPLFKSGDLSLFTNYRPVSVLPAFSEILERIVHNRLINFLNKYSILSCNQYGFRKNHSTAYALIQLYDKLQMQLIKEMLHRVCLLTYLTPLTLSIMISYLLN